MTLKRMVTIMNPEICRKKCNASAFTLCAFTEWSKTERFEQFKNEGHNIIGLFDGIMIQCNKYIDDDADIFTRMEQNICLVSLSDNALDVISEHDGWKESTDSDGFIVRSRNIDDNEVSRLHMYQFNDRNIQYCPFYMEHEIYDWNCLNEQKI